MENIGDNNRVPQLEKIFCNLLTDTYWAEKQLNNTWKMMREAATSEFLKDVFEDLVDETQEHIARIDRVFISIRKSAEVKKCDSMEGLMKCCWSSIKDTQPDTMARDVALIVSAQQIEHYKIAAYTSLVQMALTMQLGDAADMLDDSLIEEMRCDHLLTQDAEFVIDEEAEQNGSYSWNE